MNREIEFRGKCVPDSRYAGEWVTGGYVAPEADCKEQDEGLIISYFGGNSTFTRHVIPETVGQFTGLLDKNGKKIFEGDILLWTRKNVHIEGRTIQDFSDKCIIYYDNDKCGFRFRCKLDCGSCVGNLDFSDDRAKESYIEIIGNVYDNPELLNEK